MYIPEGIDTIVHPGFWRGGTILVIALNFDFHIVSLSIFEYNNSAWYRADDAPGVRVPAVFKISILVNGISCFGIFTQRYALGYAVHLIKEACYRSGFYTSLTAGASIGNDGGAFDANVPGIIFSYFFTP